MNNDRVICQMKLQLKMVKTLKTSFCIQMSLNETNNYKSLKNIAKTDNHVKIF